MKKGVESLIAWVLLIGFSVALAVFVTRWSLQQAQKSTEGVEEMIMGDIQCNDVAISGYCDTARGQIKVKNRGTLTIKYLIKMGDKKEYCTELKPNSECKENLSPGSYTPVIEIDDKKVICTTQKQEFTCPSP